MFDLDIVYHHISYTINLETLTFTQFLYRIKLEEKEEEFGLGKCITNLGYIIGFEKLDTSSILGFTTWK